MARVSEEVIQQILSATDIVDLIGSYFPLKRAGKDYRALCPFHNEKTPSFYVIPNKQSYHCFGCSAGGTALRFVMDYENVDFRMALKKLADRAGLAIPEDAPENPEQERQRRKRSHLLHVLGEAARFYHNLLKDDPLGEEARSYLAGRGTSLETAEQWSLGYAPEKLPPLVSWAKSHGFTARDLIDCGLASLRDEHIPKKGIYPRFRRRLMFPIHNDYGDVVAFSGRLLDPEAKAAKYINTAETGLFHKGDILYGLHRAKRPILKRGSALVCEGQMDLIALAAAGFEHAVAPLGTALTPQHARHLKRHTQVVYLCYDGDAAGLKATDRAFFALAGGDLDVRVALLPDGEDPDSLLQKHGPQAIEDLLSRAVPYLDHFFTRHAREMSTGSLAEKANVARMAAAVVAAYHDPLLMDNALRETATRLSMDPEMLRREARQAARQRDRQASRERSMTARSQANAEPDPAPAPMVNAPLAAVVRTLTHLALISPDVRQFLRARTREDWESLPGADLLGTVLASDTYPPEGDDATARAGVNAFLASFPPEQEKILHRAIDARRPPNPMKGVRECLARLDREKTQNALRKIRDRMRQPGLSIEEVVRLQKENLDLTRAMENQSVQADPPPTSPPAPPESSDPF